jgi:PEP-CTERM motif
VLIVVPGDVRAGRWVSNLVSLAVFSAAPVPEPETYTLLLAGLVALRWAVARPLAIRTNSVAG